jgi:Dolichyl-phosphate-mannose-protein mannosyltransferase
MKTYLRIGAGMVFAVGLLLAETVNLESTPPLWWDEGWNLTAARNWLERGHYGPILDAKPIPASIASSGFPTVGLTALSFRLFGVGIWQGRVVGILSTIGALAFIYYLALQLYDKSVAIVTLMVVLFMSGSPELHPVIMGRQAIGEIPAIFYLLGGYACLLSALRGSSWFIALATVFWGIALSTKLQVLPFWTLSLLVALSIALFKRKLKLVGLFAFGLVGSLILSQVLLQLLQSLIGSQTLPMSQIRSQYEVTFWVPFVFRIRLLVFINILLFGMSILLGLYYAGCKLVGIANKASIEAPQEVVRLALFALTSSWIAWYLVLSVGWLRYLFPATFVGSIFAAAFLHRLTDGFSLSSTIKRGGYGLRHLHFNRENAGALLAIALISITFPVTLKMLYRSYVVEADTSVLDVADFLNAQTVPDALIETYDSELFFLLNRRYHYPSGQIDIELNRRTFLGQDVPINYDPLAADPDYLVVGPQNKLWQLYDPVLATGAFRFLRSFSRYDLYERVR